jgi:hypothetical protein
MSSSYERPGNEITFPDEDTVLVNGSLEVKSGNAVVLQTTPTGLTTGIINCTNVVTGATNVNALASSVGNLTTVTTTLENDYHSLNSTQQQHTQDITRLGNDYTSLSNTQQGHTQDITNLQTKTTNQSAVTGSSTSFVGDVTATRFVRTGGQSTQYLMADGSVLAASNTNSNATMHFFKNSSVNVPPPSSGEIVFNSPQNSSATVLWISHMTSDGTDVHAFLKLMTPLSVLYIQDNNDSENYVKYGVVSTTSTPTMFTVTVNFTEGNGNGLTTFGHNHDVFLSIFSNNVAIDGRFTTLEGKTATLETKTFAINKANFGGDDQIVVSAVLNMQDNRIARVGDPDKDGDAVSRGYADGRYAGKSGLFDVIKDGVSTALSVGGEALDAGELAALGAAAAAITAGGGITAFVGTAIQNKLAVENFFKCDGTSVMTDDMKLGATPDEGDPEEFFSIKNVKDVQASGDVTAAKFIKKGGGLSTEFLKADGSYDSKTYITNTDGVFSVLDGAISDLQTKTQNIKNSTSQYETNHAGSLVLIRPTVLSKWTTIDKDKLLGKFTNPSVGGAQFSVATSVQIEKIYIESALWGNSSTTTRVFRFWTIGATLLADYELPRTTLEGTIYTLLLPTPLTLAPGTYRYGIGIGASGGTFTDYYSNGTYAFDSRITNVTGYYLPSNGFNAFPTQALQPNAPLCGGFFLTTPASAPTTIVADQFIKTGGGMSTEFLKSNGTYDSSAYITATDLSITNLQTLITALEDKTRFIQIILGRTTVTGELSTGTLESTRVNTPRVSGLTTTIVSPTDAVNAQYVTNQGYATQLALDIALAAKLDSSNAGGLKFCKISSAVQVGGVTGFYDLLGGPANVFGSTTFAANELKLGSVYIVKIEGIASLPINSGVSFQVRWNNLSNFQPLVTNPAVTNGAFSVTSTFTVRRTGVTGEMGHSSTIAVGGGGQTNSCCFGGGGAIPIDTTEAYAMTIVFSSTGSAVCTAHTITCARYNYVV